MGPPPTRKSLQGQEVDLGGERGGGQDGGLLPFCTAVWHPPCATQEKAAPDSSSAQLGSQPILVLHVLFVE